MFGWGESPLVHSHWQKLTGTDESQKNYDDVNNDSDNQAKFSHEALAGAASFGAFKMFEDRQRADGTPPPPAPFPSTSHLLYSHFLTLISHPR